MQIVSQKFYEPDDLRRFIIIIIIYIRTKCTNTNTLFWGFSLCLCKIVWPGGVVVRASVAGPSPGRSASRTTLDKLFTHMCLRLPNSINWYRPMAVMLYGWEGNRIDLASHWPCVTDSMVYPAMGSMAWQREMSIRNTTAKYGIFTLYLYAKLLYVYVKSLLLYGLAAVRSNYCLA